MAKHDKKTTHAAHIKRHTAGTSNEISFSVLDAAKNALDGERGLEEATRDSHLGRIPLFTLPGRKRSVGTPTKEKSLPLGGGETSPNSLGASARSGGSGVSGSVALARAPQEEVARRKTTRKRHRLLAHLSLFVLAVAVVGGVGWWLYQGYSTQQKYAGELDQALQNIDASDETIVAMDDALTSLFALPDTSVASDELVEAFLASQQKIPEAESRLKEAAAQVDSALEGLGDSVAKEAASRAVVSVESRLAMIKSADQVMKNATDAAGAARTAEEAWALLLSGDAAAREAAQLVATPTEDNMNASIEQSKAAATLFEQADEKFASAANVYSEVDFSDYRAYLAKRIEAMGYAVASNEAFLVRDKETASAQNDSYNAADAEAAAMAKEFAESPTVMVAQAMVSAQVDARNDYETARSQASTADAFLRDYLGTTSK